MKFKNGRDIKQDDEVVGLDHCGRHVTGTAIKGIKERGQEDFVLKHGVHGAVVQSLSLTQFLHADDHKKLADDAKSSESKTETIAASTDQ